MTFIYITSEEQLEIESKKWNETNVLGIDTEGENNFHHYGSYLSIIQLSDGKDDWIIDILELKKRNSNMKYIIDFLENKNIEKIFHDVSFDLRILQQEFNCRTRNLFDTYLALMILGEKNNNLANVLEKNFNVKKEKKYQKADWTIRPIKTDMLKYAVGDSKYLIELKIILEKKLLEKNRLEWAKEEFLKLENNNFTIQEQNIFGIKGSKELDDIQRGILNELFLFRERLAKKADRPVHFIINNERMIEIVKNPPKNNFELQNLKGIHPIVKRNSSSFFETIENRKIQPIEIPLTEKKRMNKKQKDLVLLLSEKRDIISNELNLEKQMILTKDEIIDIAINNNFKNISKWKTELIKNKGIVL